MTSPKSTRVHLTIAKKVEILDLIQAGKKKKEVCLLHNLAPSTLSTILKHESKLRDEFDKNRDSSRLLIRKSPHSDMEQHLVKWIRTVRENNVALDGPLVQEKAMEFASLMGLTDFQATQGWLARFKKRENLNFQAVCGEAGGVDSSVVQNWIDNVLPSKLAPFHEDDVFNVDETGLFYQLQPSRTLHFRNEKCTGGKQSKERISVLVGSNMSGTEKLKLLVIGKSGKPRCFKNVKSLPVHYRHNKKAWMTKDIFCDWLKDLDKQFRAQRRHCLLIVDNCPSHPNPVPFTMTNLTIAFLPKNTTSHTQPCDAGIIRDLKHKYRRRLVKKMLHQIDSNPEDPNFKPNVLDAIRMIAAAWELVKPETLKNCFRKAGWKKTTEGPSTSVFQPEEIDEDEIPLSVLRERLHLPDSLSFDDYVNVDNNLETSETVTEESILAELTTLTGEEEEEEEDAENETVSVPPVCSFADAKKYIEEIRRFFESSDRTHDSEFSAISQLDNALFRNVQYRQSVISDFFHPQLL